MTKEQTLRCAIYVRVSTDLQANKEFSSLDTQEDVLQAFVRQKNEARYANDPQWVVVKVYREAKSAKDTNRPRFQEMLRDAEAGVINMIVFLRLDRFTRSVRDFLDTQVRLKECGCGFVSRNEPMFDTSSPHGEAMTLILLVLGQLERKLTSDRVKRKIAWRAEQGLWNGLPVLGYDMGNKPKGILVVNPKEATVVRAMFKAYLETRSLRDTAARLNHQGHRTRRFKSRTGRLHGGNRFSKNTVWQWLTNPAYIGKIRYNGTVLPGKHAPLIDQKLWESVQEVLKDEAPERHGRVVERKHNFLLEKMAYCGLCGSSMVPSYANSKGERHFYYRCRAKYNGEKDCPLPVVRAEELEALVIAEVRKMGNGHELAEALRRAQTIAKTESKVAQDKLKGKQSELAKLMSEERNVLAFIKSGGLDGDKTPQAIMSELESLRDRITKTREDITGIETELQPRGEARIDPAAVRDSLNFFDTVFDLLTEEEKAQLIKTFIQKVTYSLEKIQIRVYDELLNKKTKEGLREALSVPEPAGVSSGSLSRNKWLPD